MSNEKYNEKLKLYQDAMLWNKPERVLFDPMIMSGWMALDAGYTAYEVNTDYEKGLAAQERYYQTYDPDMSVGPFRFYFNQMNALGGSENGYGVNGEGGNGANTNVSYENVLSIDDYELLKQDEMKTIWEKVIFNLYPKAKNFTAKEFAEAVKVEVAFREASKRATENNEKYGVLYAKSGPLFYCDCYVGMLFNQYRGIKSLAMDLRRHADKVYDLCEYKDNESYEQKKALMATVEPGMGVGNGSHYDVFLSSLAHTILNRKQVEKLIIAPWKKQIDLCVEKKKTLQGTVEGNWAFHGGIGEFLNEYPKGTMIVMVESDNPFEVRQKLPNIGIWGGLETDVMGQGTPEQCVAMAKKAIDELGRDGGLLLAPNKMTTYKYDMKPENLKAVNEFVRNYKIN